ncbi:methyltransferase type 12 [Trypanosoma conorhini]|uniref:Small RNA 2'-O-methyltransferase n=1 Tax=Trypanosoma conorhini TaxID=83891 RepID=A0A3R7NNA7_9TRYP|nr:methyltransferase type 12 [Trypanosoma conorhini]RNF05169.1 methyltransferase type 12 [Trypanosoma conorhini]
MTSQRGKAEGAAAAAAAAAASGPPFSPPLYLQRAQKILQILQANKCRSFIDAGCSRGDLLRLILPCRLCEHSFTRVMAVDLDEDSIREASVVAPPPVLLSPLAYLHPMRIDFVRGDLTRPPRLPACSDRSDEAEANVGGSAVVSSLSQLPQFDAVISVEVLEHMAPQDVPAYTEVLFAHLAARSGARIVVITTPNRDRNLHAAFETPNGDVCVDASPQFERIATELPYPVRHVGHKFEMTAAQFKCYCDYVVEAYCPLWASYTFFGVGDNYTQGAIFYAASSSSGPFFVDDVRATCTTFAALKKKKMSGKREAGVLRSSALGSRANVAFTAA